MPALDIQVDVEADLVLVVTMKEWKLVKGLESDGVESESVKTVGGEGGEGGEKEWKGWELWEGLKKRLASNRWRWREELEVS